MLQIVLLLPVCVTLFCGCGRKPLKLNAPNVSPYPANKVWAVAPFMNESGTSAVDSLHIADLFTDEVQKVRDIDTVPVTRVLEAMRALEMDYVSSIGDAQTLARVLDVDGLVVGTITSYNPYHPPRLGMTVQLYTRGELVQRDGPGGYDIGTSKGMRLLGESPNDHRLPGLRVFQQPVASASAVYDASENTVRLEVQEFARGRTDPDSALGWERFLYSMDQYTQFVSDRLLRDLLREERRRVSGFADRRFDAAAGFGDVRSSSARW